MLTLTRAATRILLPAALLAASLGTVPAFAAAAGRHGGGTCVVQENGQWVPVQCVESTSSPGKPGSPSHFTVTCKFQKVVKSALKLIGLPPAPKGFVYEWVMCPAGTGKPDQVAVDLVNTKTGQPALRPQQLLNVAARRLFIPAIGPLTAPPRGDEGLVGLPEWFWVPARDWHPVSVTVTAGPVWARATATPGQMTFHPGGGLPAVSCAGPGRAYDPSRPAAAQATDCSYQYAAPSAGQPDGAYQAGLTVTWKVTWTGSGGAGGVLNTALPVGRPVAIRIAQGEALVTGP